MKPADVEALTVQFETNPAQLEKLLPDGFTLRAPIFSAAECEFANIGYFGGHTYTLLNLSIPVHYHGAEEDLDGDLILVMFENAADPIVGGRDLLGYSKIYADMPRYVKNNRTIRASASSWGFKFMDMTLELDQPAPAADEMKRLAASSQGKFNYKYIQTTPYKEMGYGTGGADVCYPTFNPRAWEKPADYPLRSGSRKRISAADTFSFTSREPMKCRTTHTSPDFWPVLKSSGIWERSALFTTTLAITPICIA